MDWIEKAIIAAIVVVLVLLAIGMESNRNEFERACTEVGGKMLWDGRQYQCLGAKR